MTDRRSATSGISAGAKGAGYRNECGELIAEHIEAMADALKVTKALIGSELPALEAAERWLMAHVRTNEALEEWTPSKTIEHLERVNRHCCAILKVFGIQRPEDASDGPQDDGLNRALATVAEEHDLRAALAHVARLAAWTTEASQHLVPPEGASAINPGIREAVRVFRPGNSGDAELNGWVAAILKVFQRLIIPQAASDQAAKPRNSMADFRRFLAAAGKPIGLEIKGKSWDRRIERIFPKSN